MKFCSAYSFYCPHLKDAEGNIFSGVSVNQDTPDLRSKVFSWKISWSLVTGPSGGEGGGQMGYLSRGYSQGENAPIMPVAGEDNPGEYLEVSPWSG